MLGWLVSAWIFKPKHRRKDKHTMKLKYDLDGLSELMQQLWEMYGTERIAIEMVKVLTKHKAIIRASWDNKHVQQELINQLDKDIKKFQSLVIND
jgi:hypothetical protein